VNSVWHKRGRHIKTTACTERTSRVVTYTKRAEHIHPILDNLRWLPINYRIEYKVVTLAFKILSTGSPAYLLPAVNNYIPTLHLRSSFQLLLTNRLLPLSRIVCRSKFAFPRLQDNFAQPFVLIIIGLLLIIDHVTVYAPTIRPSHVDLRSVIKSS